MKLIKQKIIGLAVFLALTIIFWPITAQAATSTATDTSTTRIYGYDRYETAAKIAEAGWEGTTDCAILAPGMDSNLVDALTAGPLAAQLDAPILLTEGDSLNHFAQQELTKLAVKKVIIIMTNGPGVNIQNLTKQVKAIPTVTEVESLGGSDTAETSTNIAKELTKQGAKISKAIIVGGSGVDALSISSIAGAQGIPILYSGVESLPNSVNDYLNSVKGNLSKTYIIGGTAVVSDAAASQLPGPVERVAGIDRYETNIEVLKEFSNVFKYKTTYLANGDTLVDALAVSPLAALSGSPILLTSLSLPDASGTYARANLSPHLIALGGEAVVPANVLSQLSSVQVISQDGISQGPGDSNPPALIDSVLKITGNNTTLSNSLTNNSLDILGNNTTLNNVKVNGTIFLDPGDTGTACLQNVTAANLVVLSGGSAGIELQNVTANMLIIAGGDVQLKSSGTTNIAQTTLTSSAGIDNSGGGSFGPITVTSALKSDPAATVQLTGTFTQPVSVNDMATLISAPGSSVLLVTIAEDDLSQTVTLQGAFANVLVNRPSNLILGSNASVVSLVNNTTVSLAVRTSATDSQALIAVGALSTAPDLKNSDQAGQSAGYYGEDSGTSSNPYKNDFYIGQLGYGLHQHYNAGGDDANGAYFNKTGASDATWVYGYWLISGLSMAPTGTSAAQWGQQQAQAASKAFQDMSTYYGSKVKLVLFADVEATGGGLDPQDYANNQAIYTAFITWLQQNSSVKPGTYSSPYEWNKLTMGANFAPLTAGYYWVADYPGGTPDQSVLNTSNQYWVYFPQTSEQAQIWQFEGTPDYDLARVLPG
ncbi:cell wall-binding repeat-containing protein [Desulfosporosinus sp. PR]|uniref:cell wall-binding repeat-containing protein n=1 Tax=Candidatus Desulfosporosinus nitrosoreducens TaxID=3401928 RepID=UPI0027EE19E0|nr:cell wall-binding repeat-containing protein [Desulfosporosinus sp. PR]MDQ7093775.1 cell wall-binding repeat-containing protein [Desulfosporosinus sp. PR]